MKAGSAVASMKDAIPGDLLFYGGGSHVAIYIGNNKAAQALNSQYGVGVWDVTFAGPVTSIRRVAGGSKAAAAAATGASKAGGAKGSSATTSSAKGGAIGTSLSNNFLSMVKGSWLNGGGTHAGGGPNIGGGSSNTTTTGSTGGTGSTTLVGGASGSIKSPTDFSRAVLSGLGLPATQADVQAINEWQQHEGQWTVSGGSNPYYAPNMHDPLNTNLPMPGGHALSGTWSYPDWATGVKASVSTIKQSNMAPILKALQANADLKTFGAALESTPWAASKYGGSDFGAPSGVYAMGDPSGTSMAPMGRRGASPAMVSGGGGGGFHGHVTLHMPVHMPAGSTGQDAQRLVRLVVAELKGQQGLSQLAGG
jgi:hypothetical protein